VHTAYVYSSLQLVKIVSADCSIICGVEIAGNYTAHMRHKVKAFFSGRVIAHQLNVQMMDQVAT
jgi:hypothetical protein